MVPVETEDKEVREGTLDPFDPSRLSSEDYSLDSDPNGPPPRHRPGEKFLKGPIPWPWIEAATRLPGQALAVGLAIWFEAGCQNRKTVAVTQKRLTRLGISRDTARRALQQLESAGLVSIGRAPGQAARVTLRHPPSTDSTSPSP